MEDGKHNLEQKSLHTPPRRSIPRLHPNIPCLLHSCQSRSSSERDTHIYTLLAPPTSTPLYFLPGSLPANAALPARSTQHGSEYHDRDQSDRSGINARISLGSRSREACRSINQSPETRAPGSIFEPNRLFLFSAPGSVRCRNTLTHLIR
ncbi:hypothetical protein JB92DRAFT_3047438, partial [Gautieria morchelliformis]